MKIKKTLFTITIVSCLIFMNISVTNMTKSQTYIANLVFKTNGGGVRPDYGLFIAQYLRDIDIDVSIVIEEWSVFVNTLLVSHDFDLAFIGLSGSASDPDQSSLLSESGSLNMFGLNTSMAYGQENEDMLQEGKLILDLDSRQAHYYQWQQLIMDKIVPMLPFYSPREYTSTWSNLIGFDLRWGVSNCLPYMTFSGLHSGQISTDEFNDHNVMWSDLNPLFLDDTPSSQVVSLIMEPLIVISPDFAPLKTGLVYDWDQIDDYHYKFYMRDNIYWNPSYNILDRTSGSGPLNTTGVLMNGLKGENSNGTTQKVTAKDAVFTFLALGNSYVSGSTTPYEWISDIFVDPVDKLVFHVFIDGDPDTPQLELYAPFWGSISPIILPEFFLNSSDTALQTTSGGVEHIGLYNGISGTSQWQNYSTTAFGCGKYMLDYYVTHSITSLTKSPYWMGIGAIDGSSSLEVTITDYNIRVIPDSSVALSEFQSGKLDILEVTGFPTERKIMQADPNFDVQTQLTNYRDFLAFNLRRLFIGGVNNSVFLTEPGKEEYTVGCAIRKAICHAIDRVEINNILHDGEYFITHSPIPPLLAFYYYDDIVKYDRNLTTAMEWLDWALHPSIPEFSNFFPLSMAIVITIVLIYKKKRS